MITVNPKNRISAAKILSHDWIKKYEGGCCDNDQPHEHADEAKKVIESLKKYRGQSLLKRTAINILVKSLSPHQIDSLKHQFQLFDTDNSGFLEKGELKEAI